METRAERTNRSGAVRFDIARGTRRRRPSAFFWWHWLWASVGMCMMSSCATTANPCRALPRRSPLRLATNHRHCAHMWSRPLYCLFSSESSCTRTNLESQRHGWALQRKSVAVPRSGPFPHRYSRTLHNGRSTTVWFVDDVPRPVGEAGKSSKGAVTMLRVEHDVCLHFR